MYTYGANPHFRNATLSEKRIPTQASGRKWRVNHYSALDWNAVCVLQRKFPYLIW